MTNATFGERIGVLERVASSTAFIVLLVFAGVVLGPTLVLGLVTFPLFLREALATASLESWLMVLLPFGGAAGVIGLFLTRRPPETVAGYRLMMLCIVIGIATALVVAGVLASAAAGGSRAWVLSAAGIFVLAIPVLAALGRVARLWRLRAAAEARAPDAFPLIFLAVALAELALALTIAAELAMVG